MKIYKILKNFEKENLKNNKKTNKIERKKKLLKILNNKIKIGFRKLKNNGKF